MVKKQFLYTIVLVVFLDQLTKFLAVKFLQEPFTIIPDFLYLRSVTNTGAAFSMLQGMNLLLIIISLIVVAAILYYYKRIPKENIPQIMFALIAAGGIGNLISRIFLGHVIDFIYFTFFPTFNIADSAISIGAITLIIYFWKK